MMKKLLVLLLSAMMVFSLVACGGDDASGDYTDEQAAYVEAYNQMLEDYQAAIDLVNATPELVDDEDLVTMMNEITDDIDSITDVVADPEKLTDEFMAELDGVIEAAYIIINRIDVYAELLPILTIAGVGADADENTYWYACNEDETVGAMVILSADETQNVYCAGEMVVDEDGVYTITDERGYTMSFYFEEADEDGLIVTLQDGTEVYMMGATPRDVVEMMLTIEETTENVNQ